jgi:anti-anti-sigma factor
MLTYTIENRDGVITVGMAGRIDNEGAVIFQEALDRAFAVNPQRVIFDLQSIAFINSTGIGKLLLFYKRLKNRNGEIAIAGIHDDVHTLFKAIRLDKLIPIER